MDTEDLVMIGGVAVVGYFLFKYMGASVLPATSGSGSSNSIAPAGTITAGSVIPGGQSYGNVMLTQDVINNLGVTQAQVPPARMQQIANMLAYYGINPATADNSQIAAVWNNKIPDIKG